MTRLSSVAEITGTAPSHFLGGLSESASLDLLMQMACRKEEEMMQDPDIIAIGKEIVRKCSGVPLVVQTVGSLLFFKKTKPEWLHFKDNELPEVSQKEDRIVSVLRLSYDYLPSHLKQCFALCSLFPKDYEIEKQTLVNLWVAEGFIQPSNKNQHLEDIAHEYFMDLLRSNLFQDYQKDKETCKMHDLMHDLACLVAGTECWRAWDDTRSIHERTRHISVSDLPISRLKASPLRTFLSLMGRSEVDIRQLMQSFKRLRVLELHDIGVENMPRSICKLKHLTYLDLSENRTLERLPNSITRLHNLQTLNLNSCFSLEELPRGIRKLVSLRNLYIDDCWKLSYVPRGLGQLNSLHRLTRFILPKRKALAKNYCRLGELNGLNNIMGSLCIENLESVTDVEAESRAANLIRKRSLESLALKWGDFDTDDAIIVDRDEALLDGLQPHSSVQKLTIEGYKGESFPRWMMDSLVSSLPNLVEVRLRNCKRCKRLSSLGQLPHLKTLTISRLTELEYIESDHSSTSTGSFPSLLKLKIFDCMKLKAMPLAPHLEQLSLIRVHPALINMIVGLNKLKSLEIRMMEFLECVPEEYWKSLASLESLIIQSCPGLTSLSTPTPSLGTRHQSNQVDLDSSDSEELDLSKYHESSSGNNNHLILELHSLRFVYIDRLPKLASLPQWLLQASNLEDLSIQNCKELDLSKYHESSSGNNNHLILELHSLRKVEILFLPKLASLPQWLLQASNLEHLSLSHCEELDLSKDENGNILNFHGGLQSLRSVEINRLPKLASLPPWLLQASNLEDLSIWSCEELDICKDESGNIILDFHGGLQSLRSVEIGCLPKLASLPPWLLQASNLEHLELRICRWLMSLPEGMRRLASLTHLQIYDCPELERRCKRDAGEDWYKIAHIPHIYIN